MDDARKLLDSLMGPSRNKHKDEQRRSDGWKDAQVCKRFLVAFCPNNSQDNWFKNTRRETGICNLVHSESLKEQFQAHPERPKYQAQYEKELLKYLEGVVAEADSWIRREKANCKPAGKELRMPKFAKEDTADLKDKSDRLMKEAEDLIENGEYERSKSAVETAKRFRETMAELEEKYTINVGGEEVCEVCGVRCQPGEVADFKAHLDGRLHESYTKVREHVRVMREKLRHAPEQCDDASGSEGRGRDRRDRDRDRDRGRDKSRDRDRDRERERGRGRGDAQRSRSRDRGDRGRRRH